jgi:hypothetical protein
MRNRGLDAISDAAEPSVARTTPDARRSLK